MNKAINTKQMARTLLSRGLDEVATIGQLIGQGLTAPEATKLVIDTKKEMLVDSNINPLTMLSTEWVEWLKECLGKGCDHAELVGILDRDCGLQEADGYKLIHVLSNPDNEFYKQYEQKKQTHLTKLNNQINDFEYEDPFVKVEGNVIDIDGHEVRVMMHQNKPPIIVFENVLTAEECDELINLARPKIRKSKVVDNNTGESVYDTYRKSSGSHFEIGENELIQKIEKRVATLMNQPIENGEGFQILNYQIGGEYKPHYDYFDPHLKGSKPHLRKGGQRVATMVIYLNDVEEGGGTAFPEVGLTVNARKGSAVYFEYCNSKGQVDKMSLHAGCPVIKGEKWILTKWVHERAYV